MLNIFRTDEVSKPFGDSPKSDSNMTMTTNSIVDSHSSRMSEMCDYYKHSSRIERPDQPDRLSFGKYVGKSIDHVSFRGYLDRNKESL